MTTLYFPAVMDAPETTLEQLADAQQRRLAAIADLFASPRRNRGPALGHNGRGTKVRVEGYTFNSIGAAARHYGLSASMVVGAMRTRGGRVEVGGRGVVFRRVGDGR